MDKDTPKPDLIMKKFEPISQGAVVEQTSHEAERPDSVAAAPSGGTAVGKPDPKQPLRQSLGNLAHRMRRDQTGWLAIFGFSSLDRPFRELRAACQDLEIESLTLSDDAHELLLFRGRINDLEASYNRLRFRLVQVPSFIVLSVVSVAVAMAVVHSGIIDYLQHKMGIKRVMRYVVMAIAGALLWGLTSLMAHREAEPGTPSQGISVTSVLIRVMIAIVVPTIIVMLTFKQDGTPLKLGQIWKSPEAWSFLAGYSCRIIILGLNKLVEKVSKMIESL